MAQKLTRVFGCGLSTLVVALVVATSGAHAATLNVVGGQLLGATDVNVGGTLYDVEFLDGTCIAVFDGCDANSDFAFTSFADATLASQALLNQVFLDGGSGAFDTEPQLTVGCETTDTCIAYTPYGLEISQGLLVASLVGTNNVGGSVPFPDSVSSSFILRDHDTTGISIYVFAVWSPVTAPPSTTLIFNFFSGLGDLPGNPSSSAALGVSADGSTVVGYGNQDDFMNNFREAFVWDATNGMTGLGDFPGGNFWSQANAVSADGSIVVGRGSVDSGSTAQGFIWDATNGMQPIGDLPGGSVSSQANAVSADGSTVVGESSSALGVEGFVWNAPTNLQGVGDLAGSWFRSMAFGVSADGSTVVGRSQSTFGAEAFIWDATNGMTGLGELPGGLVFSKANAVSADGTTVVGLSVSSLGQEGFIWDGANTMRGIGDLAGGIFNSVARGVSADGSIVVGSGHSPSGQEAVVWDEMNGIRSIAALLTVQGIDLTGWLLFEARGVSADGKTIVGTGINPDGDVEAWMAVAVVPEPATSALTFAALATLFAIRRVKAKNSARVAGQATRRSCNTEAQDRCRAE